MSPVATAKNTLTQDGNIWRLSGRLDSKSVPLLIDTDAALFSAGGTITVDLSAVEQANSAGVALLIDWLRRAKENGQQLQFTQPSQQIRSLAKFGGADEILGF